MSYHFSRVRSSRLVRSVFACAALLVLQACSEPLSIVNEVLRGQDERRSETPVQVESQLVVSDDGHVSASGAVQRVSAASFMLADATFKVTDRTSIMDVENRSMSLADVSVGTYLQLEGEVAGDGSYVAVSVQEDHTVMICHVPRGNPDNAHTISVGERATEAHLAHGDYEGECEAESVGEDPDDEEDVESDDPESDDPDEEKVAVCHIPPGNPDNAHTINIGVSNLQDHLDHGDYEGECLE